MTIKATPYSNIKIFAHTGKIEALKNERHTDPLIVRNVPDELHRALRMRAAIHGHSMEAEVREILKSTLESERRVLMGDALAELAQRLRLTNNDFAVFEQAREGIPAEPIWKNCRI
jgi:plasmid stability protein